MKDVEHCRSNAEPEADVADTPDLLFRILQQVEFFIVHMKDTIDIVHCTELFSFQRFLIHVIIQPSW